MTHSNMIKNLMKGFVSTFLRDRDELKHWISYYTIYPLVNKRKFSQNISSIRAKKTFEISKTNRFFKKEILTKLGGRGRDRGLQITKEVVNFESCDLIKAWEVKAVHRVVVETSSSGLTPSSTTCIPQSKFDFFDVLLLQQTMPRQV